MRRRANHRHPTPSEGVLRRERAWHPASLMCHAVLTLAARWGTSCSMTQKAKPLLAYAAADALAMPVQSTMMPPSRAVSSQRARQFSP
jgi:hypothetical protein